MSFSRVHLNAPERPIVLRGFCARYRELSCGPLTFEDDREGYFARGAHDSMLESGANVHLQFGSHDERCSPKLAFTSDASLQLFASRFGLHFEATIWPSEHKEIWGFLDKLNWIGVSMDCLEGCNTEETTFEGKSVWRVKSHAFTHIALLHEGKFMNSRCWRPDRISTNGVAQAFDSEWVKGQAESRRTRQRAPSKPSKRVTSKQRPSLRAGLIIPRLSGKNAPREAVAAYQDAFNRMR